MNLKIRPGTVGYNNKILISEGFSLGKNDEVNAGLVKPEEKTTKKDSTTIHKDSNLITKKPITTLFHKEEKIALILFITGGFTIWFMFR